MRILLLVASLAYMCLWVHGQDSCHPENEYECPGQTDGCRCKNIHTLCDGIQDCPGGDDESEEFCERQCQRYGWWCDREPARCLHRTRMCDGSRACGAKSERANICAGVSCPRALGYIQCGDSSQCVPLSVICHEDRLVCDNNWFPPRNSGICDDVPDVQTTTTSTTTTTTTTTPPPTTTTTTTTTTSEPAEVPTQCIYTFGESCYEMVDESNTWRDASDYCVQRGGHLAFVESAEEHSFLAEMARESTEHYWLGGRYIRRQDAWVWADSRQGGADLTFTAWMQGFPFNGDRGNCLFMSTRGRLWSQYVCNGQMAFICEYPRPEEGDILLAQEAVSIEMLIHAPSDAFTFDRIWTVLQTQLPDVVNSYCRENVEECCGFVLETSDVGDREYLQPENIYLVFQDTRVINGDEYIYVVFYASPYWDNDLCVYASSLPETREKRQASEDDFAADRGMTYESSILLAIAPDLLLHILRDAVAEINGVLAVCCGSSGVEMQRRELSGPITCAIPTFEFGVITCENEGYGMFEEECAVECETGYFDMETHPLCNALGDIKPIPTCAPITCPLVVVENGRLRCQEDFGTFGEGCRVRCDDGYEPAQRRVYCGDDGQFSDQPICIEPEP